MKITILSSSFGGGGISAYAHELINCLSPKHNLTIVLGDDSVNKITNEKVSVYYYSNADLSINNAKNLISLINDTIKPDILIGSQSRILPLIVPFLSDEIKIVTISHSLKYVEADIAGFHSKYYDNVVALSSYGKEYLRSRFGRSIADKLVVVPNSVKAVDDIDAILFQKYANSKVVIVYTGGTNAPKTPEIVAETVLKLSETNVPFDFYWLGNTLCPLRKFSLLKDVNDLFPKDERIHILGTIKREEVLNLLEKANVLLLPSRREGSSVSLLEAMSRGVIPIVADFKNANREVVKTGVNGFVLNHNNIDGFVHLIHSIINNRESYNHLYREVHNSFIHDYSFKSWYNNMNCLMDTCQANHKKRSQKFNTFRYLMYRGSQRILHMSDFYLMHLQESLPTALKFSYLYMKKK